MAQRSKIMVFDFDGTVSLGDGPVRSYARLVAAGLDRAHRVAFLDDVDTGLAAEFDAASATEGSPALEPLDGYDLVRQLAAPFALSDRVHSSAYALSRAELATAAAPVLAPRGLATFLADARRHARLVLATNAPDTRMVEALDALGLTGAFDVVRTAVGKPTGLYPLLDELLADSFVQDPADALVSIGDVWTNDLEPAFRRGATTALIGPRPNARATPNLRAASLDHLYPQLNAWLEPSLPGLATSSPALKTKVET